VAEKHDEVRMLAFVPVEMQGQLRQQLAPLGVTIDFIAQIKDLSQITLSRIPYRVALMPAELPDNGWWALWGQITLLHPRPEILVYAREASFQLWSGVLEIGGYDVIVEPFTGEEIRGAVLRAAKSFEQRCSIDKGNE
jgi:DNA-binding NtrC family response regulator